MAPKKSKRSKKSKFDLNQLKNKTSSDLQKIAKKQGIAYSGKTKSMLINSIMSN